MRLLLLSLCVFRLAQGAGCDSLANLNLEKAEVTAAELVEAGSFQPPQGKPVEKLPVFCRAAITARPTSDSDIRIEVWMPRDGWNGKFQGIGNGGFAGSIGYGQLASAIRLGYAAASTDTGHTGGGTDANWAFGHPEKIVDFGHRAIHLMTVHGKAAVREFYGRPIQRSYFNSCSNGGRQALMEALRYPEDYDGIIAGAPANHWTLLLSSAAFYASRMSQPAQYLPASKLPAIQAAVRKACDAADGVEDGLLSDPASCTFQPASLVCTGPENDSCLTKPQAETLAILLRGLTNRAGKVLYPGYSPGGEAEPGGWGPWITGQRLEDALLYQFSTGFFRNMVFLDRNWTPASFDVDRDVPLAQKKLGAILDSSNPDLSRFHARGGKLILYHGWCDAAIPARAVVSYYEDVQRKMGAAKTAQFIRLFLAPNVQHCAGGSGPNDFGQGGAAQGTPEENISAALERWVEQGVAPEQIVARRGGNDPLTRPLCAYPKVARYKGAGDTRDAANFACQAASR
jgi:feruloyl esterase